MLELVKEEDEQQINDGQNENVENIGKKIGIATKIKLDSPFQPEKYPPTYIWNDGNGRILKFKRKITKDMEKYLQHFGIFTKELQLDEHRDIKTARIAGIQVHITNNDYELEWINPPSDRRAVENYKDIARNLRSKGYKVERIGCKPIRDTKDNFDPKNCEKQDHLVKSLEDDDPIRTAWEGCE